MMPESSPGGEHEVVTGSPNGAVGEVSPELTSRQQQILDLMQAGKVNKEIANKLGIGLGTVKQHIVALFKKLHVSNRAMAVSRGMGIQQERRNSARAVAEGVMEHRPCVVLSVALPPETSLHAVRMLHGIMAAQAFDNDALFLARKGNAGDIIFGIHRVTEYDLIKALRTAQAVYNELAAYDGVLAASLCGGLTAGLAGASMNRFGGWTGEAIASAAIATSRDLVHDSLPGHLSVGQPAMDLMRAFGIGGNQNVPYMLEFSKLDSLLWTGERSGYGLIGRQAELAKLKKALARASKVDKSKNVQGSLIYLEGESGMGKSRLCQEISALCCAQHGCVLFFRCLPQSALCDEFFNTLAQTTHSLVEVMRQLDMPVAQFPDLLIIDDFHILHRERQQVLFEIVSREAAKGRMVILSGRRKADDLNISFEFIALQRLSASSIEALVREAIVDQTRKAPLAQIHSIVKAAAGVPLFAVEMARHIDDNVPSMPLLVLICSRLDNLRLDRELLRRVARSDGRLTFQCLVSDMGENAETLRLSLDMAMAVGVLTLSGEGYLAFTHPLLRQVIDFIGME